MNDDTVLQLNRVASIASKLAPTEARSYKGPAVNPSFLVPIPESRSL